MGHFEETTLVKLTLDFHTAQCQHFHYWENLIRLTEKVLVILSSGVKTLMARLVECQVQRVMQHTYSQLLEP